MFLFSSTSTAQLGVYTFTGAATCPNPNTSVTTQPANATFSPFSNNGVSCWGTGIEYFHYNWPTSTSPDLNRYYQFSVTPDSTYGLLLNSLTFNSYADHNGGASWVLRSSQDNYGTNVATGTSLGWTYSTSTINLPSNFSFNGPVTFRLYAFNIQNSSKSFIVDDVTLNGSVVAVPPNPNSPTSNSPQCPAPGVTLNFNGTPPAGVTWYWQTTASGTSTANSASSYNTTTSGTYYLRAQDNTTLAWSTGTVSAVVVISSNVTTPVFTLGANSTRCRAAEIVNYTANATNTTGITYSLDATSLAGGNLINTTTGAVTYDAAWSGTSTITTSAAGCGGPLTSNHIVTTVNALPAQTPVFALGATSIRCQGISQVTYEATSANSTGITYSLDAASAGFGNTIDANTGEVTYVFNWNGTSTITATATGCNGQVTADHEVTINANVANPVFALGSTSSRCQGSGSVSYTATANNSTGITYTLDAGSEAAGNSINPATGSVTYVASWSGTSLVTATASGCNGPKSASHTITITPTVVMPVFAMGATSTRCKASTTVIYSATSSNSTGIVYSLDAASISAGLSINSATGAVIYNGGYVGTAIITATASGCGGPVSATHSAISNDDVQNPVFVLGSTSSRCQVAGTYAYTASAVNSSSITYGLNAAAVSAGNSINAATGEVTYIAGWTGTTIITATAAGCNGPKAATHTVTITTSVAAPVFALGTSSGRCQVAGTVSYIATASNSNGIVYSIDATSAAAGNVINASGVVTYVAGWSGITTITATASGCNGPTTATHAATTTAAIGTPVFTSGSTSIRCQAAGNVTYAATASNTTAISYSLNAASTTAGNTINATTGEVNYTAAWSGTSIITATATGCGGPLTSTHTVTITPIVGTPVFASGSTSSRCIGAGTTTYTATASNNTGITYSLDAASITGGNTINATTGAVTFDVAWTGASTITASATGCSGPKTATHVVTANDIVATPVFTLGSTSGRCIAAGSVTYAATAANSTSIIYSLDAASLSAGNTINSTTGSVTFTGLWVGITTITATATGCSGPKAATHTVTINALVTTPVFTMGATSTRCQGTGMVTYTATTSNFTGLTYSLDVASLSAGNSINTTTGEVTYAASWSGTTTITASATGCGGPKTANHTVTVTPTVGTPVFTLGATSTRCQAAGTVTYTATASNSTSRTYSLDAASISGGNTINSSTGAVTFVAGWTGTSDITVTAAGCNGPSAAIIHTVTITPVVGTPVFTLGATSTRCQGAGLVLYDASASSTTGITYTIDAASISGGNVMNATTGNLTFAAGWSGTTTITASAAGCSGPRTATHVITITPTVGSPVFVLGTSSTRCQGGNTVTYTANATNNTGFTYTLDAASEAAGNSINPANGAVTYWAGWTGTSVITATVTGCNGPRSSNHTVTINATVEAVIFTLGATSTRCQGSAFVGYTATAANSTSIAYALDAASISGGNTINATTGVVVYVAGWSGTTTITATAAGCNGPAVATHTATVSPTVSTPVFTLGATSGRCQGASNATYTATASNSTSITYSLDAASISAGNTINSTTGEVSFVAGWTNNTTITATAAGCNGPRTANHIVSITPFVGNPVFSMGLISVRTQAAATITYSATSSNNTSITYALDAASISAGNTINTATGAVTWTASWFGLSSITATSTGCGSNATASHVVNINPSVVQTPLYLAGPGQLLNRIDPVATNITVTQSSYPITTSASGITLDNTTTGPAITSPMSVAHTTGTGANRLMLVGISQKNRTIASVTYGSTPLTLVGENNINTNARVAIYQLVNPPSGTNTVTVNFSSAPDKGAIVSVTTYSGVHQTTPLGAFATAQNGGGTPTVTAVSATGDLVYDIIACRNEAVTVNGSQAQRWNLNSGSEINGAGSTKAGGASNTTMSWSYSNNSPDWSLGAVAIKQAANTNNIDFIQTPTLCSPLTIKAQNIQVLLHLNVTNGTMPVNPAITASLRYGPGNTNIITLSNPVYSPSLKLISWTGALGADVTVPTGQAVNLYINTTEAAITFNIEYGSASKPSRISLLPVSTFIDFVSFNVFDAPYPGGNIRVSGVINKTYYVRGQVTTPFGYKDITGMDVKINPPGSTVAVNCVDSSTCTRTYEYAWTTSNITNMYYLLGTAKEGYENLIKNSDLLAFDVCSVCPPVALPDSAIGAGGAPLTVNVLANDYDPNNNLSPSTLSINTQPNNGTGYISNGKVVYLPNGSYAGRDTLIYQICDSTSMCTTASVFFTINPLLVDPCSEATKNHEYYLPFPENEARMALVKSTNSSMPSNNIRSVISLKMPYPGMTIVWDEWEDGYELNALDPLQGTTKVWGDGNPYNGIVPGYSNDIIPAGGSIVLDNIIPVNPRVSTNIFYDGKDKITASGQIAVTQVSGEPSIIGVQCMKTNVTPTLDYGTSFTIPVGENYNSQDFRYSSLFIRAAQDSTFVEIDKDNNGSLETTATLNKGQVLFVDGGVLSGAAITASGKIGVELHFGGVDSYSSRDVPIFPATWYSHTYYSPVTTTGRTSTTPRDTAAVLLYNSLNRPLSINWSSGVPSSGSVTIPAKTTVRFPLAYSSTAAYKFVNPTGESFTAIQMCDSYTPGGGGNQGQEFDWSFNLIAENRLTDFATIAWAPGSTNGTRNDNPVWVTPTVNTTVYVKYDGNVSGATGLMSPCGMRYDVSYTVNALNHRRILDPSDNDQSGMAVFTCNGAKIAAVYGEDPSTAVTGNPSWDVGSTIQPFCKQKLIFANDDYARTMVNQPVTIPILLNDFGFLAVVDPTSVSTTALLQPSNGTVTINQNGTVIYLPNPSFTGKDTFEYNVCSTPTPIVCDKATVYVDISVCPAPYTQNVIAGRVFLDKNDDGLNNDGGTGVPGAKVYLYVDGNCNQLMDANELKDSVIVDASGSYQFISYPEKFVLDDFDGAGGARTCANGSDGNSGWLTDWTDLGDPSTGFCNTSQSQANTDAEIYKDGSFTNALRLKHANVSATRSVNLTGASYAFLSFSYRRKSATLTAGENIIVQASSDGSTYGTVYTIAGDGSTDANYVDIYNQDITMYASANTRVRFLTNAGVDDQDTVYIDNVKIQFIRYPICYLTALATATVPAYHHTTTVLQHTLTAVNAQTCFGPFDFGIAKNTISISGTLYQDPNGLTDNLINGTTIGKVSGNTVYAYLVDSTGLVVRRITVNGTTGVYTFPNAEMFTNYTLRLSTISVNLGDPPPTDAGMSSVAGGWVATGDAYGINNTAGTGNKSGIANCIIAVQTSSVSITGVNFGVERLPESDDRNIVYPMNTPNVQYDVTGGLTGNDPEDGVLGAGKTYRITQLPYAAVLYYNGLAVTLNQVINSFNPALLKIDPDDDTHMAFFRYASRDAAGLYDPTPAMITVNWNQTLPVKLITFTGRLNGTRVDLNWVTANELNSKHFEVQRSVDGQNYSTFATVAAKGNSSTTTSYYQVDPSPIKGINYYRLKMVDLDGVFEYSNVVIIRIENNTQLVTKVTPNPFTGKVDVYLTLTHNTMVDFRFIDMNGRIVFNKSVQGLKGFNWFTINDLERLQAAPYFLHIATDDALIVEKLIKQ